MRKHPKGSLYFALWAEDINQYLATGYNETNVAEVKRALIDYVSVDNDNPSMIDKAPLTGLLNMTGLQLDCSPTPFKTNNEIDEKPISIRTGSQMLFIDIDKLEISNK
jgi:hypothetical protein